MAMFGRGKKKEEIRTYDKEAVYPALKSSICTGEKVAGFVGKKTGKFEDVMLIRTEEDLQRFKKLYGISEEITKIW